MKSVSETFIVILNGCHRINISMPCSYTETVSPRISFEDRNEYEQNFNALNSAIVIPYFRSSF